MYKYRPVLLAYLICLASALNVRAEDGIKVAVASNFTSSFEDLTQAYSELGFIKPVVIYGSSGRHASQIINGLPVDVFLSADARRPAFVSYHLGLSKDRIKTYAVGRLVLYSITKDVSKRTLHEHLLESSTLAIANPRLAPYGVAAREVLESLSIIDSNSPKLVQGENVGQAFNLVHAGGATVGLVSLSQALEDSNGYFQVVPMELHSKIVQDLLVINNTAEVEHFLSFMFSDQGLQIIQKNGYSNSR